MHDQVHGRVVAGERHRHRVHEERHVVGDDVDNVPGRLAGGRLAAADPDQRPPLRPVAGKPGLLGRDRSQARWPGRGKVLDRHVPVVGLHVAGHVTHCVDPGYGLGRRVQQSAPLVDHVVSHRPHFLVSLGYNQSRSSQSSG